MSTGNEVVLTADLSDEMKEVKEHQVISVNGRKDLDKIKKSFPNMPIIIGKTNEGDKHVPMNLADMDHQRNEIVDAATKSVMGERIDRLHKPSKFPTNLMMLVVGILIGVASTFYVYNLNL